jgi:hypothetical protein
MMMRLRSSSLRRVVDLSSSTATPDDGTGTGGANLDHPDRLTGVDLDVADVDAAGAVARI